MTVPSIRSTGPWLVGSGSSPISPQLPSYQPGDALMLVTAFHDESATPNIGRTPVPDGWHEGPTGSGQTEPWSTILTNDGRGRFSLFFKKAEMGEARPVVYAPATPVGTSIVFAGLIVSVKDVATVGNVVQFDGFDHRGIAHTTTPGTQAAVDVSNSESLVVDVVIANFAGFAMSGTTGVYSHFAPVVSVLRRGVYLRLGTPAGPNGDQPAGTFDVTLPSSPINGFTAFTFGFRSLTVVVPEPSSGYGSAGDPRRLLLRCTTDYDAFITANDYETRIEHVDWSGLSWGRVLDDISEASVRVPDDRGGMYCMAKYGGLMPWRYGLLLERNGQEVWKGPITGISRNTEEGTTEVKAADALARYKLRLLSLDPLNYVNQDGGVVLSDAVTHSIHEDDRWSLPIPPVLTGVALTREVVARDFETAWEFIDEMLRAAVDLFVMNGKVYAFDPHEGWRYYSPDNEVVTLPGPYRTDYELAYSTFTNEAFRELPSWEIDGYQQANRGWILGADSGSGGHRKYWTAAAQELWVFDGVLDRVSTNRLYRGGDEDSPVDDSVFQRQVNADIALRAWAPAVIGPAVLTDEAPIDVPNLRPGSLWGLDVHDPGFVQLLQLARLKEVQVTVEATPEGELQESISCTLFPPGFMEES